MPTKPSAGLGPSSKAVLPLRALALNAAKLELLTYAFGQAIRFCSGLLLSRLLFPEAFGLSLIVGLVTQGLAMVSNVGASQSIIQSPRGDDPIFLDTAFTLLAIRGCMLWFLACLIAYPLCLLLRQPELFTLIPAGAFGVLIGGFASTSTITLRRHLRVRPLLFIELASQLVNFASGLALAWIFRSVWALIAGGLLSVIFTTCISHLLPVDHRNRFRWDRTSWIEIYGSGRWIQASSAITFASSQSDKFLIAHYVGVAALGVYNYASMLADALSAAVVRITYGVLFPVFSELYRKRPERLLETYYRARLRIDLSVMIPLGLTASSSQYIVDLLFDPRYSSAGWMLQLLCVRAAMTCMLAPIETFLFSTGNTKFSLYRSLARSAWILPGIPIGWSLFGLKGIVLIASLSEFPVAIVLWLGFSKLEPIRISRELIAPMLFAVGFIGGFIIDMR